MKETYQKRVLAEVEKFKKREQDWRNGAVVYQVLVDRFAPAENLDEKKELYKAPKTLMSWSDKPKPGAFLPEWKYCAHELEYWGGDLKSLLGRLDYIKSLGINVLYLNPIHLSLSNHKYDASDYLQISPEFGTFKDLKKLSDALHENGMKLMLDGVFNHVGVTSDLYQEAKNPNSPKHDWFDVDKKYPEGVRLWADVRSLPELNLENPEVRDYIYDGKDSVIRTYLKNGVDGWRLDVAFDIGYQYLAELTDAAHDELPGSMVVGEIWNYPEEWLDSIDGVMNFTFREIISRTVKQEISPVHANNILKRTIDDAGIEGILRSWNLLDNHDVPRLIDLLPEESNQILAQVMQFTLPGSPNLYYGTELGMTGSGDPMNRAPMRWDLFEDENPYLSWTKTLIKIHEEERALKIGDFVSVESDELVGYMRRTEKVEETVITLLNPSDESVTESVLLPDSKLMNYSKYDILLGDATDISMVAGLIKLTIAPKSYVVLKPRTLPEKSYTCYKRV